MPTLSVCPDVATPRISRANRLRKSPDELPSRRADRADVLTTETWDAAWTNINSTDASTLRSLFASVGFHKTFTWTPPVTGASAAEYRFATFDDSALSGNNTTIRATFVRKHGVSA